MDKKNTTIGVVLLVAGIAFYIVEARRSEQAQAAASAPAVPTTASSPAGAQPAAAGATATAAPATPALAAPGGPKGDFDLVTPERADAQITTLENSYIQVRFTDFGGAIDNVALQKRNSDGTLVYPNSLDDRKNPEILNEQHVDPIMAMVGLSGLDRSARFQLVSRTANEVVYRATVDGAWEVTRRYTIAPDQGEKTDPYQLRCETTFHNLSGKASAPLPVEFALGTAEPINFSDFARQLVTGYSTASGQTFVLRGQLEASNGLFGLGAHAAAPYISSAAPFTWAVVKNQFFSTILTPDQPGAGMYTRRIRLNEIKGLPKGQGLLDTDSNAYGLTGNALQVVPAVAAGGEYKVGASLYIGPNEYRRLSNMDVFTADQDRVMQFGTITGWASRLLLLLMANIHSWVPNWGFAIILTTLTLKIAFLPLTLMAARSARRMQKIQPEMAAIKEKYKDNPQKLQAATIELYKVHKVNPAGACIPMLLPLPFFFGFFYMLMSSSDLRFAPFLGWVQDLSAPDTIAMIHGFPIRILPLIFVGTSIIQMMVTPQPQVEGSQATMMRMMPLFTLFIYYRYSCALSLYSTTNALFSIGQQYWVNSRKDDGDPSNRAKVDPKTGRPVKNITPKRS